MSFSYWIDPEAGLVVAKLEGVVTVEELVALQEELRANRSFVPTFKVLTDASAVSEVRLDSAKIRRVADNSPFTTGARRALVATPGVVYGLARMFEMMTAKTGVPTQVFLDRNEAFAWLSKS